MGPDKPEISLLIACGQKMVCELYAQALGHHPGFRVVGSVTSVGAALKIVRAKKVDVALITPNLADGPLSGFQVLEQAQESFPSLKSIVLFERSQDDLTEAAFRAGARGLLCPAEDGIEKLCRCVERVHEGQVWASSAQLVKMLDVFSRRTPLRSSMADGISLLTKRERDVVRLVEEGLTNRQIAKKLHLSEHTVRNNMIRIFDKLGVSTRVELALYVINGSQESIPSPEDTNDPKPKIDSPSPVLSTSVQ